MRNPIRARKPNRPATLSGRARWLTLACSGVLLLGSASQAADPAWWQARGAITAGATPAPNAVVNQGQLKQFTLRAVQELNASLASVGGAGQPLNSLITGWQQDYASNAYATSPNNPSRPYKPADFDAVTVGQLKYVANLLYGRLHDAGYMPVLPAWIKVNSATDRSLAALGQLKSVFNFDLGLDPSGSGLPIAWEIQYFGHTDVDPNADADGDGLNNLQEFQAGSNPNDFYNAQTPMLTIVSGDRQTARPGRLLPAALVINVGDANSLSLFNGPVTFSVASGGGLLKASSSAALVSSINLLAGETGQARVYFQLPAAPNQTCQILCVAGVPPHQTQVVFTAISGDASTPPIVSPFAPANFISQGNADGSLDLSWENNTDDQTPVEIELQRADGSWRVAALLAPGTTSYHLPKGQ